MGKAEAVVHGLEEEHICTAAVAHSVSAELLAAILFPLNDDAAFFRLSPSHQLGGLLGFCHGVLVKVRLNMPNDIDQSCAADQNGCQTQEHILYVAFGGKHTEALQPAP